MVQCGGGMRKPSEGYRVDVRRYLSCVHHRVGVERYLRVVWTRIVPGWRQYAPAYTCWSALLAKMH